MHPIVWFDIRAANIERAQKFYGKLFQWKFEQLPGMDYWRINLGGNNALTKGGLGQRERNIRPSRLLGSPQHGQQHQNDHGVSEESHIGFGSFGFSSLF